MSRIAVFLILLACAALEAGGDALMRKGMHAPTPYARAALSVAAAAMLFSYGWLVNRPPWSFGSVIGVYMVLFFVVTQLLAFFMFGERPAPSLAAGGALIVAGGLVITLWH